MANAVLSFILAVVSALENAVRCTFISFVSVANIDKDMKKTNNPYIGRVQKRTSASGVLFNANYVGFDANGNELPKEERNKEPLRWGVWRKYRKTIDHNGKVYMRCYFTKNTRVKVEYLLDGRLATAKETEEIKSFLYAKSNNSSADARGKLCRTYDITNLTHLHINKVDYDKAVYEKAEMAN